MLMSFGILSVLTSLSNSTLSQNRHYDAADAKFSQETSFKCTEKGFHSDPRDCKVFYRCVDSGYNGALTSFKFECGVGTIFSKNKGDICVHPSESERHECGDFKNEIDSVWRDLPDSSNSVKVILSTSNYPSENVNDVTENNQCIHEGFMEDHRDCRKFYRCVKEGSDKYVKYAFTCGTGTIWDQYMQGCNHAWSVSRKECKTSLPELSISETKEQWSIPTDSSGTRGYLSNFVYPGQLDQATHHSGHSELAYPSQSDQPVYPYQPNQPAFPSEPSQPNQLTYPSQPSQPNVPGLPGKLNYPRKIDHPIYLVQLGNSNYPEKMNKQTSLGSPGIPHKPARSSVPPTLSTSVLPPKSITPNSETRKTSITQLPISTIRGTSEAFDFSKAQESKLSQQESTSSSGFGESEVANNPETCTKEGFFPDPGNCRKFYRCVDEGSKYTKYEFQCGSGTGWDSNHQTCNHLYLLHNCDSDINTTGNYNEPDFSLSDGKSTATEPSDQSPSSIALDPVIITLSYDSRSTSLGSDNIMFTFSTKAFSAKASKTSSLYSTISSTYLPPNILGPTSPSYGIASTIPFSSESSFLTPPQNPSQIPMQGIPTDTKSDNRQKFSNTFSPTSSALSTESMKPESIVCQGDGFYPNISNCKKFYRCVKNSSGFRRFDFDCGPGTAWDQGLQTCNYISLVSSCESSNNKIEQVSSASLKPIISEVSEMFTTLNSNELTEANESSNSAPSSDKSECLPAKQSSTIVCTVPGFYAHPTRYDKFYRCVDNGNGFNVYYFDCPPGTIFDPSISVCNYPESVYPTLDCFLGQGATTFESLTSEKPLTSIEEIQETASTANPSETTTLKEEIGSQESTELSEAAGTSLDMTTLESGNDSTEVSTDSSSIVVTQAEANTQNEGNSVTTESSITTQANEAGLTETISDIIELSSTITDNTSEISSSHESTTTAEVSREATENPTDFTEQSGSGSQETTTQSLDMTNAPRPSSELGIASCPIAANLTDEEVLLICPTGFRRHPKFCNLLYQCISVGNTEIRILTLSCPENTIFDEMKVQCLPEVESSQPCTGNKAKARFYRQLGENTISPVKLSTQRICPTEGHYPYKEGCSSVFYQCKKNSRGILQGYLYKCPKNFVYWSVSRSCERVTRLPLCTRLGYTTEKDSWERRWEVPIEDSNLSARMLHLN